ncbi:hypothetical protein HK100_001314 [Physocladia obscura]|uniref:EF-hand domain-containing protein n=1 Tax=Physocladia obscura TaxID=109957 RepID=A0AAD5XB51_9FUNG|nr:hypothetical protein HK100_001314 [Physocladia obscura]
METSIQHQHKKQVLFICTHNSARSQIAEGLLNNLAPETYFAQSAGTQQTFVRPLALKTMAEINMDISHQFSKTLDRFLETTFDYVITVCDAANESCPYFKNAKTRLHWSFPDPSKAAGSEDEQLAFYNDVRDQIRARIENEWYIALADPKLDFSIENLTLRTEIKGTSVLNRSKLLQIPVIAKLNFRFQLIFKMVGKNKTGAQKRKSAKVKAAQAQQQQGPQVMLTPAQAAALVIRQQQHQVRLDKIAAGTLGPELASQALAGLGKTKRAPLLSEADDSLLPNVRTALLEIFARFDDDNDKALNRNELERFAIATNGEKFEESAIDELKKSFHCDQNGNLTRDGFLEMYQLQTLSDPNETWRDLIKHGYSINVQLVNRATGSYDPNLSKQDIAPKKESPPTAV